MASPVPVAPSTARSTALSVWDRLAPGLAATSPGHRAGRSRGSTSSRQLFRTELHSTRTPPPSGAVRPPRTSSMLPRCPPFPGPSDPDVLSASASKRPGLSGIRGHQGVCQCKASGPAAHVNSLYRPMPTIDAATADELVETVRSFVRRDVLPVASELDHADTYPDQLVDQLAEFGLFGALIPESYGGLGLDVSTYARIVEELAAGWMSLTGVLNTHMIAALLIRQHGSDEQRDRLLPRDGERPGCGAPCPCRNRTQAATPGPFAARPAGTATSTCSTAPRCGSPTVRGPGGGPGGPHRRRHHLFHRGEGAGAALGRHRGVPPHRQARLPGRRDRGDDLCRPPGPGRRRPRRAPRRRLGQGLPQILGALELGRVNVAARGVGVARAAFEAAISLCAATGGVRRADRPARGHRFQAGRHGPAGRSGPVAHPFGRREARSG